MTDSAAPTSPAETSRPVLVVEDETGLRELVTRTLTIAGFEVIAAGDLASTYDLVAGATPAVGVLDVMLPDGSGFDLSQTLRTTCPGIGILFLTARDSLEDRLTGFAYGGDDYLTKPFSVAELVARVTALHRRVTAAGAPVPPDGPAGVVAPAAASRRTLQVADVVLDEAAHTVTRAGTGLDLSPTEFKLLRYLLQNADVVVSKEQIIGQVWRYDFVGDTGVVEKFISQLRRKLDVAGEPFIETVRGFGYTVRSG